MMDAPLSPFALGVLLAIEEDGPIPSQEVNPGVAAKLIRDGYAKEVQAPSPYKTHKGRRISHLFITSKGRLYAHDQQPSRRG